MLADRIREIEDRIGEACALAGRRREEVVLVAVSKTFPAEAIREAYDLGLRDFGESRLQEALPKMDALPDDIRWHFIGHLQSNKARKVAERCDVIHSLCNVRQLTAIESAERPVDVFVEVNIGREEGKSGILPEEVDAFVPLVLECRHSRFCGLMAIGPYGIPAEETRKLFSEMRRLNERVGGRQLSLGMSGDFELAIQEGSTHVRIGTAIFGSR